MIQRQSDGMKNYPVFLQVQKKPILSNRKDLNIPFFLAVFQKTSFNHNSLVTKTMLAASTRAELYQNDT